MTVDDKIRYYRELNGLSRKELGTKAGFSESTAAIRISQYENNQIIPKSDIMSKIADALNVDVSALANINISNEAELLHVFFELETHYGVKISKNENSYSITFEDLTYKNRTLLSYLDAWYHKQQDLDFGLERKNNYNLWQGRFPLDIQEAEISIDAKLTAKFDILKEKLKKDNFSISTLTDIAKIVRYLFENIKQYDVCPHPQAPMAGKDSFVGILSFENAELLSLNEETSLEYAKFLMFVDYFNSLDLYTITKKHTVEGKIYTDFYIYEPAILALIHCIDEIVNTSDKQSAKLYYESVLKKFNVTIEEYKK